jgi:hypothetical protein
MIQTVIFPKKHWNKQAAIRWLLDKGFLFTSIDTTTNFYRFRQSPPTNKKYYTVTLPNHVELVYQE